MVSYQRSPAEVEREREREREREGDTQPFLLKSTCRFFGALEDAPPELAGSGVCPLGG